MTLEQRIERLELLVLQQAKPFYTVNELAALQGVDPFTCREWCRLGRVRAIRSATRAGAVGRWLVPHAEWLRLQAEGLLPRRVKC